MLELTLRGLGVAQLAVLAAILLQTRRRDYAARTGAALCVSLGAFMLTSMPGAGRVFGVFIYPLTAICATHPVWFWLFCAALFSDRLKLNRSHVLAVTAMALAGVLYQAPHATRGGWARPQHWCALLASGSERHRSPSSVWECSPFEPAGTAISMSDDAGSAPGSHPLSRHTWPLSWWCRPGSHSSDDRHPSRSSF